MAPALAGGGYASEALVFAQGLAKRLEHFRLRQFAEHVDYGVIDGLPPGYLRDFAEEPNGERFKGVVVCHSPPDAWEPSKFSGWDDLAPCPPLGATHVVGRTMYETDSVPDDWVERCNKMDSVWVPTEFHRESFLRAGVEERKLVVVGEPVDAALFDPSITKPLELPTQSTGTDKSVPPFRFLAVFKWEKRKGWDALLSAYFAEFGPHEPVELVLKTRPFHSSDDFDGLIAQFAKEQGLPAERAPVRVLSSDLSLRELPRLYAAADAFVLPSRGEGWGRPHVEAMAMALPVIATNWSGPVAYLDESVGYPLEYRVEPVAPELQLPGHNWAEPSVPHLRALMRRVVSHPEEARARGAAARARMLERFSPEALADDVVRALEALPPKKPRKRKASKDEL